MFFFLYYNQTSLHYRKWSNEGPLSNNRPSLKNATPKSKIFEISAPLLWTPLHNKCPPPLKINSIGIIVHFIYSCKLVSLSYNYKSEIANVF